MTANEPRAHWRRWELSATCPELNMQVRGHFGLIRANLSRTAQKRSDLRICRFCGSGRLTPVHLRKCRFDLSRTAQDRTTFALVKLSRTAQDSFRPSSEATVSLSLSIGEGDRPEPNREQQTRNQPVSKSSSAGSASSAADLPALDTPRCT